MKRISILMSLLFSLLFLQPISAQFSINSTNSTILLEANKLNYGYIYLTATQATEVEWTVVKNTFNPDWYMEFCDCFGCYTNEFGNIQNSGTCNLASGTNNQEWKVGVDIKNFAGSKDTFAIEVRVDSIGFIDTVYWITDFKLLNISSRVVATPMLENDIDHGTTMVSTGATAVTVNWTVIKNTFNPDWYFEFCDCFGCYTNEFGTIQPSGNCNLGANENQEWKVGVTLNGESKSIDTFAIELQIQEDNSRDTITWITDINSNILKVHNASNQYKVFPNPVKNEMRFEANQQGMYTLRIFTISGSVLLERKVSESALLDLSNLANGSYFVQITNANNESEIQTIQVVE
jgi:hypothetical protein